MEARRKMEDKEDIDSESKTFFTKVIPKMNKAGVRQVGALSIEVKEYGGHKFVQISQRKEAFGPAGSDSYRPAKDTWITFDPKDEAIKKALQEAFKI